MLYIVGIGINEFDSIGIGSLEIIINSDIVYIERFTSYISDEFYMKIKSYIETKKILKNNKTEIKFVKRWFIEDGREIIENSSNKEVCILIYGDPLIATTYNELILRAKKNSVEYKVVHSSSGITSLIGNSGLQHYKFGKMVTMMRDPMSSVTVYNTIYENMCLGLHTLILTEYNNDGHIKDNESNNQPFFLSPIKAIDLLIEREKELNLINLSGETFVVIASKIGQLNESIISGKVKSLTKLTFEDGPNSIIFPGSLHFTEIEFLKNLTKIYDDPTSNSQYISRLGVKMLKKYIPNAKIALTNLRLALKNNNFGTEYSVVIENAENYLFDAEIFFNQGKLELAILSIGYAEGLIDAIRFQKNMNPW